MRAFFAGIFGTLASLSLGQWNHIVGIGAGLVTIACLVPVAITRWRKMFRGESAPPFPK